MWRRWTTMRTRSSRAAWSSSVPTAAREGSERWWTGAMAGEEGDEEAAWRDLVAQYSTPEAADGAAPWPVREELPSARQAPPSAPGHPGAPDAPGPSSASGAPGAPGAGKQAEPGAAEDPEAAQTPPPGWADPVPGVIPALPHFRIVRPAVPAPLPPAGDDEHYVPPVPPPLP